MDREILKKKIVDYIVSSEETGIKRRDIYKAVYPKELSYEQFKTFLDEIEDEGAVVRVKGRKYGMPEKIGLFTGIFSAARNGGGYIRTEKGDPIYVRQANTQGALNGDKVQAVMLKHGKPGLSLPAKIIRIIERTSLPVIGIYKESGGAGYIIPREESFVQTMLVKSGSEMNAKTGDLVIGKVSDAIPGLKKPVCEIVEVLGDPNAPGTDVLAIAKKHRLPLDFPDTVIKEAEKIGDDLAPETLASRKDLRSMVIFTIDPVDAKDFDDAISISYTPDGNFDLGVHIADVSHYVKENSAMDVDSKNRGMSCYLVDRVIPMLPEKLSNDLCSLKPDVDRLTKSTFTEIDKNGKIVKREIADTVIHSKMRLTYEQVQSYIDGKKDDGADKISTEVGGALKILSELTDILVSVRNKRGALDLEIPEPKVVLDDKGKPVGIIKRDHLKSHRMVEEAMLIANTVVAEALAAKKIPLLYRIHDKPDSVKMKAYEEIAKIMGAEFSAAKAVDPLYIQGFLDRIKDNTNWRILNVFLLRSLKKAAYDPDNCGHYGLALKTYTHFTSPIRRYPDLLVHRQLESYILTGNGKKRDTHDPDFYKILGEALTQREIITDTAERESVKMKTAEFMKNYLGDEFDGTITGVIPIGFFVELDDFYVEGLVHVSSLDDDYYNVDSTGIQIVGRRSKRTYRVGDRVRVIVSAASKEKAEVDFMLIRPLKKKNAGKEKRNPKQK